VDYRCDVSKGKRLREQRKAAKAQAATQAGQTPPHSARLRFSNSDGIGRFPAFCPNCGLVFESHAIAISPGARVENLSISNSREQCPRCGAWADLPDGTFNVFGDTIEILEATPITRARLGQLGQILDRARRGEISEDQVADEIEQEDGWSDLAELFRKATPRVRHALILLLIFVVQTIGAHELEDHLWADGATNPQVKQDLSTLSAQLRDDHQAVQTEVQQAVREALDKYNAEHRPSSGH
jgi:ribosomal protein S27AE